MTETLRNKCELFERNRAAISKKFVLQKNEMSLAAGLMFTSADREADIEKLEECRRILNRHTGFFSEYREAVKLVLLSEMSLSDDAEQYIVDVKAVYKELHKGHFKDNSYMILAAMLGSGEKGHSESGEKGHFSVRKKGPTHQRLFYSDYWLLATMESSFTGLHS